MILRRQGSAELPMELWIRDLDCPPFIQLPVAPKDDPWVLERLVGPLLPERLTQEDKGADLDYAARNIGLVVEDNEMGRARAGRVDELEFDLRGVGQELPIDGTFRDELSTAEGSARE